MTMLLLSDFNRHGRIWRVDEDTGSIERCSPSLGLAKPAVAKGFVKNFTVGGPLAVVDTASRCLVVCGGNVVNLAGVQISGSWSPLVTRVTIQSKGLGASFVDISILDYLSFRTDPTWDSIDATVRNVVEALENWARYARRTRST